MGAELCELVGLYITINKKLGKLGPTRSATRHIVSRQGLRSYHIGVYYYDLTQQPLVYDILATRICQVLSRSLGIKGIDHH